MRQNISRIYRHIVSTEYIKPLIVESAKTPSKGALDVMLIRSNPVSAETFAEALQFVHLYIHQGGVSD